MSGRLFRLYAFETVFKKAPLEPFLLSPWYLEDAIHYTYFWKGGVRSGILKA